jgi:hypothetical protein
MRCVYTCDSCHPAYVKYQFYKQPEHRSIGQPQNSKIFWDDTHVIFLGLLNDAELREFLNGPPLDIEVHDRDRIVQNVRKAHTLFGNDLQDDKIANVSTVNSTCRVEYRTHNTIVDSLNAPFLISLRTLLK